MSDTPLNSYLVDLALELRKRGVVGEPFIAEVHDHLIEMAERGERQGMPREAAERQAVARFGDPRLIAVAYAAESSRTLHRVLLVLGVSLGLAIAYIDSRPTWDDAGVTAFALLITSGVLGMIGPQHPWRWALAIGAWIPLHLMLRTPTLGTFGSGLVILTFPITGACAGTLFRRAVARR